MENGEWGTQKKPFSSVGQVPGPGEEKKKGIIARREERNGQKGKKKGHVSIQKNAPEAHPKKRGNMRGNGLRRWGGRELEKLSAPNRGKQLDLAVKEKEENRDKKNFGKGTPWKVWGKKKVHLGRRKGEKGDSGSIGRENDQKKGVLNCEKKKKLLYLVLAKGGKKEEGLVGTLKKEWNVCQGVEKEGNLVMSLIEFSSTAKKGRDAAANARRQKRGKREMKKAKRPRTRTSRRRIVGKSL